MSMTRLSYGTHGTDQLQQFHRHLNEQHPKIQFTREEENNNQISFLDILIKRKKERITTTVYRKPTNTERYTPFFSHHHPRVKSGTIRCLAERARRICDKEGIREEMNYLRNIFRKNGYPNHLITRNLKKIRTQTKNSEETEKQPHLFLPYVQGISEKIEVACRKMGVRTSFKSNGTLRQILTRVKTKPTILKKKGVVYRIPCQDCETSYIGETKRSLRKRITEHKYAVENFDRKNGIAVHAWDMGHRPDWEAAEILEVEPQLYEKKSSGSHLDQKHTASLQP